jgi:FkbM family methyltransferase
VRTSAPTGILAASCGADVIAFEPSADAFAWLERNIALNSYQNRIDARMLCVSDCVGSVRFTEGLGTENRISETGERIVPATTLDVALAGRQPTMIKIDVEGEELRVLKGAARTLANPSLQFLIVETTSPETVALLVRAGFQPNQFSCGNPMIYTRYFNSP